MVALGLRTGAWHEGDESTYVGVEAEDNGRGKEDDEVEQTLEEALEAALDDTHRDGRSGGLNRMERRERRV